VLVELQIVREKSEIFLMASTTLHTFVSAKVNELSENLEAGPKQEPTL